MMHINYTSFTQKGHRSKLSSCVNYSAYYASIIPDAVFYLLCSKIFWHNWVRPTYHIFNYLQGFIYLPHTTYPITPPPRLLLNWEEGTCGCLTFR